MFSEATTTEWSTRPATNKRLARSVPFFEDEMAVIEVYEAASGNTAKQNGFASANAATKIT